MTTTAMLSISRHLANSSSSSSKKTIKVTTRTKGNYGTTKAPTRRLVKKCVYATVSELTKNDNSADQLVQDLLDDQDGPFSRNIIPLQRFNDTLNNLKILHTNAQPGQLSSILGCVLPLGEKTLRDAGFSWSNDQMARAKEKMAAADFTLGLCSPPSRLTADQAQKTADMQDFVRSHSRITVHRSAKDQATYAYTGAKDDMYKLYTDTVPNGLKRTSFFKHWPRDCVAARTKSDMCAQCVAVKALRVKKNGIDSKITALEDQLNAYSGSSRRVKRDLMQKIDYQKAQLSKLQPQLELAQVHEDDFKAQRDEYQRQMEHPESHQAIITLDFKENWRVGLGPEQTGRDFYRQQQVSQLGVVIVTLVNGKPQKNVLNIFSKILSHDARVTRDCLDIIMKQDILKDITDIQFWSDCGPHFRCREYLYHALFALPDKHRDLKVTVNLMAEYHGKNEVDALFGTLTTWYSQACKTAPINSLDELMGVFKLKLDAAQKANEKAAMEASNSNSNSNSNSTTKKAATELAYDADHVKQIVYERNDRLPGATTYHTVNFKGFRRYLKFTRPAGQPMEGIYPISADPYQDPDPDPASVSASASAPVGRGRPRKNKVILLLCVYYRSNTATGINIRATKETVQDDRQDKRAPQRVTQGHPRQVDGDDDGYDGADTAVPFSSQVAGILRVRGGIDRDSNQPKKPATRPMRQGKCASKASTSSSTASSARGRPQPRRAKTGGNAGIE